MEQPLLRVEHLRKVYKTKSKQDFAAVQDISFTLSKGETLGIVGESGSGKTTVAKMIAGMIPTTAGTIFLNEDNLSNSKRSRSLRQQIQYIFQDPVSSLNPKLKIKQILAEPLKLYFNYSNSEINAKVDQLLEDVRLPKEFKERYPRELSGGQCQRIGIARALAAEPSLIVCDEPTSALDMTIQSQILDLMKELQHNKGFSYIFIAHGLEVIYTISHHVLVMKQGEAVEFGETRQIFNHPNHPYTQSLIQSIPKINVPYFEN